MYHITCRGTRRAALFYSNEDRQAFLLFLEIAMKRYPFKLHAFCLMTNHVHLQIETISHPISKIMQFINWNYRNFFNKKNGHSGHVFDKRYSAVLVDSWRYVVDLSKYIHLNPLKAGLVKKLEDYIWSSYPIYARIGNSDLVTTNKILSFFPEPQTENYLSYHYSPSPLHHF